jgi:hypothetical protein
MAGAEAFIGSLLEGKVPLCQDGLPLEPLDYISLIFPNKGANISGNNVCYVQERFQIPALRNLLPDPTDVFTPDDVVDALACLVVLCTIITLGMIVCKYTWELLDPNFAAVKPQHKKWYVVSNLSKAFFLSIMACSHRYWLGTYRLYYHDLFQILEIKRCGVIYVATDAVALYMVPKLPRSTVIHHVATIFLVGMATALNLELDGWDGLIGVSKMSILYAIFSTVAYSVNAYLAFRVVYPKAPWLNHLVKVSLWTYLLCCACNWSIHAVWLINLIRSVQVSVFNLLYMLVLATIVHDDVVLIKWLMNKSSPMAASNDKEV